LLVILGKKEAVMIYTVLGPIDKEALGVTLPHEHFKWETDEQKCYDMYYSGKYDETAIEESYQIILPVMIKLKALGIDSIVEASPPIGGQNIQLLHRLSKDSGIRIIPSTGWNVPKEMYEVFPDRFAEQLSNRWTKDFEQGLGTIDGCIIRPSYIKLLLDRGALNTSDKKMLEAAIMTSNKTGMGIHCHILEAEAVPPVLDLLKDNKMNMERFIWAHADYDADKTMVQKVLETGAFVGIDSVQEKHYEKCCDLLQWVIELGYEDKVFLSEDLDFFEESTDEDEMRCGRLISSFLPYCISRGISSEILRYILTINPSTFYNII